MTLLPYTGANARSVCATENSQPVLLFYTSRVICKGQLTMEEIIFRLKHYWRFVDLEPLELQALS